MCVSKMKEIHARVTEFCSGNEMRTSGRGTDGQTDGLTDGRTDGRTDGQTDGRTDGHPRRRQYPPPPLRRAGNKKGFIFSHNSLSFIPNVFILSQQ